jgi:DNA polymerase (family 10)
MPTSGDIDVLISCINKEARTKFISALKKQGIIVEVLASGSKKFMGISKLQSFEKYRHIDIIESKPEEYAFGILYFTGSGGFNAMMRGIALEKGYSMNEYRLSHKLTKKPLTEEEIFQKLGKNNFEEEIDIFKFIDMEYVLPEKRINITPAKVFKVYT